MVKKAFVVTGLGYGDEGKGTTVHSLTVQHRAHTVIRTGGPQALHRVVCNNGKNHVFSQFGSGTLCGAATHLSKHMMIDPHAILGEGEALQSEQGLSDVFDMMTIHEDALVITPFQAISGRVRESMRTNRLGSVGIGVGETALDAEILKDDAIRAKDLTSTSLRNKLRRIQSYKWAQFEELADRTSDAPQSVRDELVKMEDPDTVQWAMERFEELVRRVKIVDTSYVAKQLLGTGTVVFEGSQGVLLDRYHGFHPYTTKVRATPATSFDILRECGYRGDVKSLGVLRAYHTRHGGGPFVCESKELTKMLPDASNTTHAWQGNFRVGAFDAILARYAIEACKGQLDGLVMTCVDRVAPLKDWKLCTSYESALSLKGIRGFFEAVNIGNRGHIVAIKHNVEESPEKLMRQEKIGEILKHCKPNVGSINNPWRDDPSMYRKMHVALIEDHLKFPVVAVSFGETEKDKIEIK